jgi:hypothetical protein
MLFQGLQLRPPQGQAIQSHKKEEIFMIGPQIGETKGKRIVRRVLSTDPLTVEVSFEDSGQMLSVPTTAARGIYLVFKSPATIVELGELLRCSSEEQHTPVADSATWPEFTHARARPADSLTILRHVESLAVTVN